jgi:hypothetical protein
VTSATLQIVEPRGGSARRYLVIRLKVDRPGGRGSLISSPEVKVTDSTGKACQPIPRTQWAPTWASASEPAFAFEAPPRVESLRVEVPTAAWGATATFHFTVPKSMIRTEPGREK